MSVPGIRRFPAPPNRIPNFVGAEAAAAALAATAEWEAARTVKSNPDSPQLPVRVRALEDGKFLYMAVPRLAEANPFFVLDPAALADPPRRAVTIKHAARSARTVALDAMVARRPRRRRLCRGRCGRGAPGQGRRVQRPGVRARGSRGSRRPGHGGRHDGARRAGPSAPRDPDDGARCPRGSRRDADARRAVPALERLPAARAWTGRS